MDGIKLNSWKYSFTEEANHLQIEFDSFFKEKKLDQYYEVKITDADQNLSLVIIDDTLPEGIKKRLEKLLLSTKPEDSI